MTTVSRLSPDEIGQKTCWRCAVVFRCGAQLDKQNCWCDDLPAIRPSAETSDCLCPTCLNEEIALQRPGRVDSDAVVAGAKNEAARASLVEGEDYYREGAAIVFTAAYHLRRGTCCGSGCRHCPYKA